MAEKDSADEASDAGMPVDALIAAYLSAAEAGVAAPEELYIAAHPEHSADLKAFFENRRYFQRQLPRTVDDEANRSQTLTQESVHSDTTFPWDHGCKREIGDYDVREELGRGGEGIVYRARHRTLNRDVALKVIRAGSFASAESIRQFIFEARHAAGLDHPNIVTVFDVGTVDRCHYFSMKLVEGGPLTSACKQFKETPLKAVSLISTIARAVHYAHRRGIIHRDIKPGNILLDSGGNPHIGDFGLSISLPGELGVRAGTDVSIGIDQEPAIVGTLRYMAPEQASGERVVTTACDICSLGLVLWELLAGEPAFAGSTRAEIFAARQNAVRSVRAVNPAVTLDLDAVCQRCLEANPADRYSSAEALADDLDRVLKQEPVSARPMSRIRKTIWFARRYRTFLIMLTAILVSLASGLIGTGVALRTARLQRDRATTVGIFLQEIATAANRGELTNDDLLRIERRYEESPAAHDPQSDSVIRPALAELYRSKRLFAATTRQLLLAKQARAALFGEDDPSIAIIWWNLAENERAEHSAETETYRTAILRATEIVRREDQRGGLGLGYNSGNPVPLSTAVQVVLHSADMQREPGNARLLGERGAWLARSGLFAQAANDFQLAGSLDPPYHWWPFSEGFMRLQIRDIGGYRHAAERLLNSALLTKDPWVAERAVKLCSASPEMDHKLLRRAMDAMEQAATGPLPENYSPWLNMARGMSAYRTGRFADAIAELHKARPQITSPAALGVIHFYEAMALSAAGDSSEALSAFRRGLSIQGSLPRAGESDLGDGVENWILFHLAREETERALKNRGAVSP